MNIVVGSAFRNSVTYLDRYLQQIEDLRTHAGLAHKIRVVAVVGDSTDDTPLLLLAGARHYALELQLIVHNHGGPRFGSTETPERLKALSGVGNAILEGIVETDDVLVYVESDLLWSAHTVGSLIDMAVERRGGFDVFAPMVFAGNNFYDVFAFRGKDGERFSPFIPYHSSLVVRQGGISERLVEVSSVGSCLVMRREVSNSIRIPGHEVLVGWCRRAREAGYKIAVHTGFKVSHP